MNNFTRQTSPRTPLPKNASGFDRPPMNLENLNSSTAGGRVLWSTKPAPLLVLARYPTPKNISKLTNRNMSPKRPAYSEPFGVFFQ